ncbi:6-carboxytetrahydropterin synthase [bacterium]|nr:6-carboxytetrahydropterin synthase [bacterium]
MYRVIAETAFSACHQLRDYEGTTERLHGHNWRVVVAVEGRELSPEGYLVDFLQLQRRLETVRTRYEHELLNEIPPFDRVNPTAELLAREIAGQISDMLEAPGVHVAYVRVEEAPGCWAEYRPD